jgi:hypothetical protein
VISDRVKGIPEFPFHGYDLPKKRFGCIEKRIFEIKIWRLIFRLNYRESKIVVLEENGFQL